MESHKLKKGDTVMLKSGSPLMAVYAIEEQVVRCCYFTGEKFENVDIDSDILYVVDDLEHLGTLQVKLIA